MAQDRFLQRVDSLFRMLHLERQPGNVDDIHTLTIDGNLNIYISGMDDQWILFFSEIKLPPEQQTVERMTYFLTRNLFPKFFPPIVLAYDEPTESVILWSCEMMSRIDDAELFQMFDNFFKFLETLAQEIANPASSQPLNIAGGVAAQAASAGGNRKRSISEMEETEESLSEMEEKKRPDKKKPRSDNMPGGHIPFV